jgi:hypothetical protein
VVTRCAAGILQRKDLVVIEDAHETSCYPVVAYRRTWSSGRDWAREGDGSSGFVSRKDLRGPWRLLALYKVD